jgi:hypothetical protein
MDVYFLTYILFHGFITAVTVWALSRDKATEKSHWVVVLAAGTMLVTVAFLVGRQLVFIAAFLLPIGLTIMAFSALKPLTTRNQSVWAAILVNGLLFTGLGILAVSSFGRLILPMGIVMIIFSLERLFPKSSPS